jgi:hypothetical protein
MYVGRATYERAIGLVTGFDLAQPDSVWQSLQKRVQARCHTGPSGWPWVLLAEALSVDAHNPPDLGPLTPEENRTAIAHLCSELRAELSAKNGEETPCDDPICTQPLRTHLPLTERR